MASSSALLAAFYLFITALIIFTASASDLGDMEFDWYPSRPACQGSIADCMAEDGEIDMDTDINRHLLTATLYISYGALLRNSVPCSMRGMSYYNCRPGAPVNPYNRGCNAITQCRS